VQFADHAARAKDHDDRVTITVELHRRGPDRGGAAGRSGPVSAGSSTATPQSAGLSRLADVLMPIASRLQKVFPT
jgi:hypothetical protein